MPRFFTQMGIRGKLFLSVILSVVIIFVVVSLIIYSNAKKIIVDDLNSALTYEKGEISVKVNQLLQPASDSVELLNANAYVRNFISQSGSADKVKTTAGYSDLVRTLNLIKSQNKNLLNVYIGLDAVNKVITQDEFEPPADYNMKERDWYAVTAKNKRLTVTDPYIDAGSGKMVVSLSAPILDDSGKLIGVAGTDISTEQITQALSAFNYKGSGVDRARGGGGRVAAPVPDDLCGIDYLLYWRSCIIPTAFPALSIIQRAMYLCLTGEMEEIKSSSARLQQTISRFRT